MSIAPEPPRCPGRPSADRRPGLPSGISSSVLFAAMILAGMLAGGGQAAADDQDKVDPHYPFRTDWANRQLPWYQVRPLEFPPHHSDHRVGGELVAADYIHRSGVMRMDGTGELVPFTLPPYGSVYYLNAEADLRDVPIGTFFLFFLNQDAQGAFSALATMQDEYTMMANHGFSYRITGLNLDSHKVLVAKQKNGEHPEDVGRNELIVDEHTRVWKGEQQVALKDLALGDTILVELTGSAAQHPRRCTDIWIGAETQKLATERQRRRHVAFLRERGLPAWIDRVDGRLLTVTLFSSEPASLQGLFKDEGIDAAVWAKEHRPITVVVANEHLRSYWPPVTRRGASVRELQAAPTDCYGCSGVRWVIEVDALLEGFRAGRNVRLFVQPSWPVKDMPFGEGLHQGGHDIDEPPEAREVIAADFPYRTDFGNPQLPWYRLQPGVFPPDHAAHEVVGELLHVDDDQRGATVRLDHAADSVHLALTPFAAILYLGAEAELGDIPLGSRLHLSLYGDAQGAFTQVGEIADEFSTMVRNTATFRLEAIRLDQGRLLVAHQVEPVKVDYHLEPMESPDFGRQELLVDAATRVWKGDHQVSLAELAIGDALVVDGAGQGRCADVWIGADAVRVASDKRRGLHQAAVHARGAPAWIDAIDGKRVTIRFFTGIRADLRGVLSGEPRGKTVTLQTVDARLRPTGEAQTVAFSDRLPDAEADGSIGNSGVRWVLAAPTAERLHVGEVVRIFKEGWAAPASPAAPAH